MNSSDFSDRLARLSLNPLPIFEHLLQSGEGTAITDFKIVFSHRNGALIMRYLVTSGASFGLTLFWAACAACFVLTASSANAAETASAKKIPAILKYGDGKPDGKKSYGGTGVMIRFELPAGVEAIRGVKLHGSRYGTPKAPDENFEINLVSEAFDELLHTEEAPYRTFKRGSQKWVRVMFEKPVEVPRVFWVAVDFKAGRTKGVYLSFDTETKGEYSRVGLASDEPEKIKPAETGGDWMVQVMLQRPK